MYSQYYRPEGVLYHHGILGMKWGVRRFQNPDGTRTAAGKKRYSSSGSNSSSESGEEPKKKGMSDKTKKALKVGATIVGAAAIAAGTAYVVHKADVKLTNEMVDYYKSKASKALESYVSNDRKSKSLELDSSFYKQQAGSDLLKKQLYDMPPSYVNKSSYEKMSKMYGDKAKANIDRAKSSYELSKNYRKVADDNNIEWKFYTDRLNKDKFTRADKNEYKVIRKANGDMASKKRKKK